MSNTFFLPTPANFNFLIAVGGHGWYDLPPFKFDEATGTLAYVYLSKKTGKAESLTITGGEGGLAVDRRDHVPAAPGVVCRA